MQFKAPAPKEKRDAQIGVRISEDKKAAFEAYCESIGPVGISVSEAVNQMIDAALESARGKGKRK